MINVLSSVITKSNALYASLARPKNITSSPFYSSAAGGSLWCLPFSVASRLG